MARSLQAETPILEGPAGSLQAIFESPRNVTPAGAAVICHPHPLHGGTMQNKVVHTLARAFIHQDFHALRFNFRGVGESAGAFNDGEGELLDALAAIAWMRRQVSDLPLWIAGFSFGAAIAVRAAVAALPDGLVSVAPAISRLAENLQAEPRCPWLVVQGDRDELVDIDETIEWLNRLSPGPELHVFSGVQHFFHGELVTLRSVIEKFVEDNRVSCAGDSRA